MGSPPESPGQIAFFAPGSRIVPERLKRFLEQIDSIDLQVQRFELTQSDVLFVGEIPRVFEPHIATASHQLLVRWTLFAHLITSGLVDGIHEAANNMELIEHQRNSGYFLLDGIDVRLPHVATNPVELGHSSSRQEIEERLHGRFAASLAALHQPFSDRVVDVGAVNVTVLCRCRHG